MIGYQEYNVNNIKMIIAIEEIIYKCICKISEDIRIIIFFNVDICSNFKDEI